MTSIADFFIELGVDADDKSLNNFVGKVRDLPKKLFTLKNAFVVTSLYGIKKFVDNTIDGTVALQNFNNQTDIAIEQLQRWQAAGQLADISLDEKQITASIQALQNNLTQIKLGAGNVSPFQLLGIDVAGKDAIQVLEDLRNSIDGLDAPTATNLIAQTGLSPNFINVLRLSKEEFDELGNIPMLSGKQRGKILEVGTAFTRLGINVKRMKDIALSDLTPMFMGIIQALNSLAQATQWVISSLKTLQGVMGPIIAIATVLGAVFAPVTTAIIALVLIIDDLVTFFQGGDSLIGEMIEPMKKFGAMIYDNMIKPITDFITLIKEISTSDIFESVGSSITKFLRLFGINVGRKLGEVGGVGGSFAMSGVGGSFAEERSIFSDIADSLKMLIGLGNNNPDLLPAFAGPKNINNTNNPVFNNTFNISTTEDAEAIAASIQEIQQRQNNNALAEFNNGDQI